MCRVDVTGRGDVNPLRYSNSRPVSTTIFTTCGRRRSRDFREYTGRYPNDRDQ